MKLTYIDIYKILIYIIIAILLLRINWITVSVTLILTIILSLLYLTQKQKASLKKSKLLLVYIILEFLLFFIQLIRAKNNIGNHDLLMYYFPVIWLLLIFPLYEIINSNFNKFFKSINKLGIIILVFKSLIWLSYNFFNKTSLYMLLGGKEDWYRSVGGISLARISGTFIDGLLLSFAVFKILQKNIVVSKIKYAIEIIFLYFYAAIIYQSRSQILFYTITLLVAILYKILHTNNKFLSTIVFLSCVVLLIVINMNFLHNFIDSFSLTSKNAGSTYTRIVEYQYYPELWKQSSILMGFGFTSDGTVVNTINGLIKVYTSDVGILMVLYQFGIIGFLIAIIPFIEGAIIAAKLFFTKNLFKNGYYLIFTVYYLISTLNFNPYFVSVNFLLPIYLAYTLYLSNNILVKQVRRKVGDCQEVCVNNLSR